MFEVWAEKEKLLGNMSLQLAISSYLHVAFVFDLKYPQGAQTLGDILQRKLPIMEMIVEQGRGEVCRLPRRNTSST